MTKGKIEPGTVAELVLPIGFEAELIDNEIGRVYEEAGRFYIEFKKVVTQDGKEMASIHSGNTNPVRLPVKLPPYTFLRSTL